MENLETDEEAATFSNATVKDSEHFHNTPG